MARSIQDRGTNSQGKQGGAGLSDVAATHENSRARTLAVVVARMGVVKSTRAVGGLHSGQCRLWSNEKKWKFEPARS